MVAIKVVISIYLAIDNTIIEIYKYDKECAETDKCFTQNCLMFNTV